MSHEYLLNRDSTETKRLDLQHEHYTQTLGYLIKPAIASNLPHEAKIADVGTGTGTWTISVANAHPSYQINGFDISPSQFPEASTIPANVSLDIHDVRVPFPSHLHATFDLVHIRCLVLAFPDQAGWIAAAKNTATLLKPGGWIQWTECDTEKLHRAVRSRPDSTTAGLKRGYVRFQEMLGEPCRAILDKLQSAMDEAGFEQQDMDLVASDRITELRKGAMHTAVGAVVGVHKLYRSDPRLTKTLDGTAEDDKALIEEMRRDVESGGYCVWFIGCLSGRKAMMDGIMTE